MTTGVTGFKFFDRDGNLILDFTDRITKVVQTGRLTFGNYYERKTVYIKGFNSNDKGWAVVVTNNADVEYGDGYFTVGIQAALDKYTDYTVLRM